MEGGLARVTGGDLTARLPDPTDDELGRLAALFNEMTGVLRDRAEEQGRFAAAGELLAGVAHEVNNPLMAIAAQAEMRLADAGVVGETRDEMMQILRQARRASKLLRGLLRFVRAGERQTTAVNLNDAVRGALDLVSYRFGVDEIEVAGTLDSKLPLVEGDPIRLEQVLVNMLSNALDAMRTMSPPRRLTVDSWSDGAVVYVAVRDTGPGVPQEFRTRLFKPFATTKGRRGTGLGLYISRELVREVGGSLVLDATARGGARFVVSLPAATGFGDGAPAARSDTPAEPVVVSVPHAGSGDHAAAAEPRVSAAGAPAALGGVRVLLVDDERDVRQPIVRFLSLRGALVVEAGDGEAALQRLEDGDVDVIIADLRMPRLGGVGLYERLQRERPRLAERVLFLSGDISQLAEPGNTPVPRERVLVKPLELRELEVRIAEFLRDVGGPV